MLAEGGGHVSRKVSHNFTRQGYSSKRRRSLWCFMMFRTGAEADVDRLVCDEVFKDIQLIVIQLPLDMQKIHRVVIWLGYC